LTVVNPATDTIVCSGEEKRAALERAVHSRTFARAEQLRAFLQFVCEAEINGTTSHLTEHLIGVEVLGRPAKYSPSEDSSVRTRAYELRQKLQKLYTTELQQEPVQIVIPKGVYTPQFVRCGAPIAPEPEGDPNPTEIGTRKVHLAPMTAALLVGLLLGALLSWMVIRQTPRQPRVDPIVVEAWRPFAKPDANVALAIAGPMHMILGPEGRDSLGLPMYPAPPETYALYRQHRPLAPGARLEMTFTENAVGFGTMNGVVNTIATLRSLGASYQTLPDRAAPISALRDRNVIMFGSAADSETIRRHTENAPLFIDFEPSARTFVVRDRVSRNIFAPKLDGKGGFEDVYGVVTVLNTRDSDRGRLGMVIFSGTNTAGTDGAAGFFSSARALGALRATFALEGISSFPAAYQVVVRCTFGDLLMISYEYKTHRVLQRE